MNRFVRATISRVLGHTPLQFWPTRVRAGLAEGARWTLYPFSSNWRLGGEEDVAEAFGALKSKTGAVCWDLGAHFGIHTVGLARHVGPTGRVYAFEPDPVAFTRLQRHVRINRLTNVELFNVAVSDRDGEMNLIISGGLGSTVTHAKYEDEIVVEDTEILASKCLRLDNVVSAGEVKPPSFVKVDVEGHAAKALAGAENAIASTLPMIVLSVHSAEEWIGSRSVLQPLGYWPIGQRSREMTWDTSVGLETVILTARD